MTTRKKTRRTVMVAVSLVLLACMGIGIWRAASSAAGAATHAGHGASSKAAQRPDVGKIAAAVRGMPLYFVRNAGQQDERVAYSIQGHDTAVYFGNDGVTFALKKRGTPSDDDALAARVPVRHASLRGGGDAPAERWAVKLEFLGANRVTPIGQELTPAVVSYFRGRGAGWSGSAESYKGVIYPELWPGIDLVYTGERGELKSTFLVKPGADPSLIRLAYRGASDVQVTDAGRLQVSTPVGSFADDRPYAYQEEAGVRTEVPAVFALAPATSDARGYGFMVGRYDRGKTLVLDPSFIVYSGFIGGAGLDVANAIAVDKAGNAYIVGETGSAAGSFPVQVGPDLTQNDGSDAFVAKIKADGSGLVYLGYIGGLANDGGESIAVDATGNAYVTGFTESDENSFPVKVGPRLVRSNGRDAFVAKINATGSALLYAGYIGGTGDDHGTAIAVDATNSAYVAGRTTSDANSLGVVNGPELVPGGGTDGFVAKVAADGTHLLYAGFIGGAGEDVVHGIAVDAAGHAFVTGATTSNHQSFPVKIGPALTSSGDFDAFVAEVEADGTGLVYAGYIGGVAADAGEAIALDANGNAYVTGYTLSDEASFPVKIGPQTIFQGSTDAFVAKVAAGGASLEYAGYIGGDGDDFGYGIAVDAGGNAYVVGATVSTEATFPVKLGPGLVHGLSSDGFVARVDASGASIAWAGFIGGTGQDQAAAVALDPTGNIYVTGSVSADGNFPVVGGLAHTYKGGTFDAFVTKLSGRADLRATFVGLTSTATTPGGTVTIADAVANLALGSAPASKTRYYLSADTLRNAGDVVFAATRSLPTLRPGESSFGGTTVTIPSNTPLGAYHVIACADDTKVVTELDETNNCVSTVSLLQVTRPDLVTLTVSASVSSVKRGLSFTITDEVDNIGAAGAGASTSRYYLSKDLVKGSDYLLTGTRKVPALASGASSPGSLSVKVPTTVPAGVYFLFACTDDLKVVKELSEVNNCKIALTTVTVTP